MSGCQKILLISDLDGTLLNEDKEITPGNRAAIASFVQDGGHFAVATGRSPAGAAHWIDSIAVNAPCIYYNGPLCQMPSGGRILSVHYLPAEIQAYAVELTRQLPEIAVELFSLTGLYFLSDSAVHDPWVEKNHDAYQFLSPASSAAGPWVKILLYGSHAKLQQAEQLLADSRCQAGCHAFYSSDYFFEITPAGCSKGSMLKELCQTEEFHDDLVCAVGDFDNDIEMLQAASYGVAMANAPAQVRQAADDVTLDNSQDAIAEVIRRLRHRFA